MQVLLVHPPIYDFTANDFWPRPYGMLRVAGRIRHAAEITLFDFLTSRPRDAWGRGRYPAEIVQKPREFRDIPRYFRRFGRPRGEFRAFLLQRRFDAVLIQTMMTYWYPGVREVIGDLRELQPKPPCVLRMKTERECFFRNSLLSPDRWMARSAPHGPTCQSLSLTIRPPFPFAFWEPSASPA